MKVEYFSANEIELLAAHSQKIGWYTESDWECFLRTGVVLGHRLKDGEIVSSCYLSNFASVGWLGAFIVDPRFQGKKLGKALIEKALSIVPTEDFTLALVATERGKRMYEQAGFTEIGNTHKFVLNPGSPRAELLSKINVREALSSDLESILRMDLQAVGYDRSKLIKFRLTQSPKTLVSLNEFDQVTGFIMSAKDGERTIWGPIAASSHLAAEALLQNLIEPDKSYRIDVPHWQTQFIELLRNTGFTLERICPLMTFAGKPLPIYSDSYFALMAQALG